MFQDQKGWLLHSQLSGRWSSALPCGLSRSLGRQEGVEPGLEGARTVWELTCLTKVDFFHEMFMCLSIIQEDVMAANGVQLPGTR